MTNKLRNCFDGKTVVVTGHTGFKGSWLSIWLHSLGAKVVGISDRVPTSPSNFESSHLVEIVEDNRIDLADIDSLAGVMRSTKPDFVFHLAAQALVKEAYRSPIATLQTNVMGTAHVLDVMRDLEKKCIAVMITSDKAYDNVEWEWGYRENDQLGGKDPYSASKGAAEFVIRTYFESYLKDRGIRVAVARAGNVIGGGDWAPDRLVPDCMRSWSKDRSVTIRNPDTTRPWQLVLEPLGGYLTLAMALAERETYSGQAFNFGPVAENNYSVGDVIAEMQRHWENVSWNVPEDIPTDAVYEASLLKLNCDKALHQLLWRPTLTFKETIEKTVSWYRHFYQLQKQQSNDAHTSMLNLCREQISEYERLSRERGIDWAC